MRLVEKGSGDPPVPLTAFPTTLWLPSRNSSSASCRNIPRLREGRRLCSSSWRVCIAWMAISVLYKRLWNSSRPLSLPGTHTLSWTRLTRPEYADPTGLGMSRT
ncbi:hypothetical protein L210DRAFT_203564 [Boletus edulis BED1]|uniref:Uncharacterized protein n=1 Tax=Boletus edulis BED1 TaxID=1328754 RepID=A0AAD4BSU9_BOLED|nr:hypothetical protein L210DRAFT_203564 [Boletus edulis BED1]